MSTRMTNETVRGSTNYRLQLRRAGVDYGYQYRKNLEPLVAYAMRLLDDARSGSLQPTFAMIWRRKVNPADTAAGWELVRRLERTPE